MNENGKKRKYVAKSPDPIESLPSESKKAEANSKKEEKEKAINESKYR